MELELLAWGDATIRLTYEDHIHGKDRVFLLGEGGLAFEATYDADDNEILAPINLVEALREMILRGADR